MAVFTPTRKDKANAIRACRRYLRFAKRHKMSENSITVRFWKRELETAKKMGVLPKDGKAN